MQAFAPKAGRAYAARRNYDLGGGHAAVSTLSPYIRHRLITEEEVLQTVLRHHSPSAAEKFIQEVYWRTYWKGWLELRPSVWGDYKQAVKAALNRIATESGLRRDWEAACAGQTGIDCFNHWAREVRETGYLHNHARMWFASIWIFTLRLPWALGADFFLRHLLDGDPAANTLGWRWVAGLQTLGKPYVATPANIAKFTEGRFAPAQGLAAHPTALPAPAHPPCGPMPKGDVAPPDVTSVLLLHDDDLSGDHIAESAVAARGVCLRAAWRSPLDIAPHVQDFTQKAATDQGAVVLAAEDILTWAADHGAGQIITPFAPVGPNADLIQYLKQQAQGMTVSAVMRPYDRAAWPHASHGFFKFKQKIPQLLNALPQAQPDLFGDIKHTG